KPDIGGISQCAHALIVPAMERLFHPVHTETLELTRHRDGIFQSPRRFRIPRQAPTLIAIHQQFQPLAETRAHGFECLHIIAPVAAMKTNLQRAEASLCETLCLICECARITQDSGGCIRSYTPRQSTEQSPAWLTGDLARKIPQREVERPAATIM